MRIICQALFMVAFFASVSLAAEPENDFSPEERKAYAEYRDKRMQACDRIEAVTGPVAHVRDAIRQLVDDLEETEKKYAQAQKADDKKAMAELSASYVVGLNKLLDLRKVYLQATETAHKEIPACKIERRFDRHMDADHVFWKRFNITLLDLSIPVLAVDAYRDLINEAGQKVIEEKKIDLAKATDQELTELRNQVIPLVLQNKANDILRGKKKPNISLLGPVNP
ncbi:MAG: hypothetical protein K2W82_18310 [Candidatus Obscuribacterales bacterium]|nr:hypothetical protein [Candidatus Obscuribacterales bacterium]